MSVSNTQRNTAIDVIRCFAFFSVVSVHFFSYIGFYDEIIAKEMLLMTFMRSFFTICVPLFLMISGYLTHSKTVSKSYYKKLIYTLSIYLLASLFCCLFKIFYLKENMSGVDFIAGFFNFSHDPYSWYVEMYIGLFLLCPFLNRLYMGLDSKKEKQILIITLLLLTALPQVTNIFFPDTAWLLNPASSHNYIAVLPAYWVNFYPITYYFIGSYLREYKINLRCRTLLLISVAIFIVNGSFNYYRSHNSFFIWGIWQGYGSLLVALQSVFVFLLLLNIDYSKIPASAATVLKRFSNLCFGAYLISWVSDNTFFPVFNSYISQVTDRFLFYPIIAPLLFLASIAMSFVINSIYNLLTLPFTSKAQK